jgi:molybdopterin converting factor small subunit
VFTVAFKFEIDSDLTDNTDAITVDEIERWLGGRGDYIDEDILYRALANNNDRNVVEHEVRLDDRYEGNDDGPVRFETTWEQREREQGQMQNWLSRVWLDEVPGAGALPLGPGSNPPVPAPSVGASLTAEEVMSRDG